MPRMKPKSPTRLTRKAFMLAKSRSDAYQKPISRYGNEAHRFPAEEQLHEVVAHDEHQHREGEQRDVAEEAVVARIFLHVADRVEWCTISDTEVTTIIIVAVSESIRKPTSKR